MITTLTPEQESKFEEYISRWTAIGLSTEPADRPKAEEVIKKCYEKGGLEAPKKIIWCGSPFSQAMTRLILVNLKNKSLLESEYVYDSVWSSVGRLIENSVRASVVDSVSDALSDSVWDSLGMSVHASVWTSVGSSVKDSLIRSVSNFVGSFLRTSADPIGDSVVYSIDHSISMAVGTFVSPGIWESVGGIERFKKISPAWESVHSSVMKSVHGAHEAPWLSYFSFMREELGLVEQTEPITGLLELALHCGWILPCKEVCFASERHNVLKMDERGRLHCTDGPAISYPDGWSIYAVRGVRVPEYVVTSPQEITVEKIEAELNAEIRRVMIDTYGQNRYMEDSGATLIHEDSYGKLYKKDLDDDEPLVMVKVVNSTPEPNGTFKEYFLRVPPNTKTAHEAVAWTFGKQDKTYNPALET